MAPAKNLLLGLPDSGKTTFLAALWHVVHSKEVPGALSLEHLEGEREYLNQICNRWRQFEPMERTLPSEEKTVRMTLVGDPDAEGIELVIPDTSGESFERILENRLWPTEFDSFVQGVDGILMFVNPRNVREPVTINETVPLIAELGGDKPQSDAGTDKPYEARLNPAQVKLVDLLQLITSRTPTPRQYRVAVIISAWDLVRDGGQSPKAWLGARLPLLHQYFQMNDESILLRIYGISAQGGDLPRDRESLERILVPSKRLQVIDDEEDSHDVTAPLRWLMAEHL